MSSRCVRKITFPHMGHYDPVFEEVMRAMGHVPVTPDPISRATVETGVKYSPEFICFPCKVNIGDELNGIAKGADTILMVSSNGQCRYRYYAAVQRKILADLGQKIDFFIFTPLDWVKKFRELTNRNFFLLLIKLISAWRKGKAVELVEQLGYYYRPARSISETLTVSSSVAGITRSSTCSTAYRRSSRPKPEHCSARCPTPRRGKRPRSNATVLSSASVKPIPTRPRFCAPTGSAWSPSMAFRKSSAFHMLYLWRMVRAFCKRTPNVEDNEGYQ